MVTPTGIGAMLQGHVLWKRGRNELQGGDAFGATEPARPLKNAEHHFEALDRFVIDVDRGPDQPPMKWCWNRRACAGSGGSAVGDVGHPVTGHALRRCCFR